jgi:hypothetical protein
MSNRRKILSACAVALLLLATFLWVASSRVGPQLVFPGRSPDGLSLAELNQVQIRYMTARYSAYGAIGLALICLLGAFSPPVAASRGMRPRAKRMRATIIASAISSVACGLVGSLHRDDGGFLSSPLNYAPGLIFGVCFARVNFSGSLTMGIYTVASGFVYIVAYYAHQTVSSYLSADSSLEQYLVLMLAGAIGGLGLAVSTKLLAGIPLTLEDEAIALTLGAVVAIPFLWLFFPPLGLALAFAIWQIPVGGYLARDLQRASATT